MQGHYGAIYGAAPRVTYGPVPDIQQHPLDYKDELENTRHDTILSGKPQRSKFNLAAICTSTLVPWLLFSITAGLMSFTVRKNDGICNAACSLSFMFVVYLGYLAYMAWRRRTPGNAEWRWYVFLFGTSLLATMAGVSCGQGNYVNNMEPYNDVLSLNVYPSVDPSNYTGQQLMDMGRATFSNGSHLDLTKSMGFRNLDTYCVAPIVAESGSMPAYDFWAVGLNCCSGTVGYSCGEFNNPQALSGLRLMRDDLRAYFRLAVQQAEATHNIKAPHPVFMHWMEDPTAEMEAYHIEANRVYRWAVFLSFVFQLSLVAGATVFFSKTM